MDERLGMGVSKSLDLEAAENAWRVFERSDISTIGRLAAASKLIIDLFARIRELEAFSASQEEALKAFESGNL